MEVVITHKWNSGKVNPVVSVYSVKAFLNAANLSARQWLKLQEVGYITIAKTEITLEAICNELDGSDYANEAVVKI